jgi:predicted lipid-binding transport protein (Tim44 family)
MRRKREPKRQPVRKVGLGLSLATLALLAGSLTANYCFGRHWAAWMGTVSALLVLGWLGLTPLAAVMLVLDFVRNRKTVLLTTFTALVFALLATPAVQLAMKGPSLTELAFRHSFQQRVETLSSPSDLQAAAGEMLARVRETKEQKASFSEEAGRRALPEALQRLQPEWVEVDVAKDLVTLDWPARFGWALEITPRGLRYRTSGK